MPSTSLGTTLGTLFAASGDAKHSLWNPFRFNRPQELAERADPAANDDGTQFSIPQLTRSLYPLSDEEVGSENASSRC